MGRSISDGILGDELGLGRRDDPSSPRRSNTVRRRTFLFGGLVAAGAAGVANACRSEPEIPPTEGWIRVSSQPSGAEVIVEYDGKVASARTPHRFTGLRNLAFAGPERMAAKLRITLEGYAPRDLVVPIIGGLEQRIDAELVPATP